jgi:hypothetical protein
LNAFLQEDRKPPASKGLAHPARINKTRFSRDNLNGMMALLNHEPSRLEAQFLDGFGSRGQSWRLK